MTINDFRQLDNDDQFIVLWEKAVMIGERDQASNKFVLYQLDGFYIEIKITRSGICDGRLRTFSRDRRLQPYLDSIDIYLDNICHSGSNE